VFEYQPAFVDALRSGRKMRERMFDAIQQQHAHDFSNGRVGKALYEHLLSAVRDSGVPEAVKEFENRFLPLLNEDSRRGNADIELPEGVIKQVRTPAVEDRRPGWSGISALCLAALLAALIVGFNAFKMTAAERPTVKEATIPAAKPTETASETTEPGQNVAAEDRAPATKAEEPAFETMTEPVHAVSAEQEVSPEH
jgi:hypothetical protein